LLVDLDLADLRPVGKRDGRRRERRLLAEARLHAWRELAGHIGGPRDVRECDTPIRAGHRELAVAVEDVFRRGLQETRGAAAAPLDDLLRRARHRGAAHGEGTRAAVAAAGAERIAVAPEHLDTLRRHAEPIAHDLDEGRLVHLPAPRGAGEPRAPA